MYLTEHNPTSAGAWTAISSFVRLTIENVAQRTYELRETAAVERMTTVEIRRRMVERTPEPATLERLDRQWCGQ